MKNLFLALVLVTGCGVTDNIETTTNEIVDETISPERNFMIRGGGRISWNDQTEQVTFTKDITIRNHSSGKVTTLLASASPVTLTQANQVAYLSGNTDEGASVTSMTVVESGNVPLPSENPGIIVLFHRTIENTLWIPWTQKELLNGDHWQFGSSQSRYESRVTSGKPNFEIVDGNFNLVVHAGEKRPAVVRIDGKLYANQANVELDILTTENGRNKLDEGQNEPITVYYIYAIPAETGRGFDLVGSKNDPDTGPMGFDSYSYLGGWLTGTSGRMFNGRKVGNRFLFQGAQSILVDQTSKDYVRGEFFAPKNAPTIIAGLAVRTKTVTSETRQILVAVNGVEGTSEARNTYTSYRITNQNTNERADKFFFDLQLDNRNEKIVFTRWRDTAPNDWVYDLLMKGWEEDVTEYE